MIPLKETKSVFYFSSSASRTSIKDFYDQLAEQGVIPKGFPHDKIVHSGIGIYNHRTGKVEYVLEGSGNRNGQLILYKNRATTLDKLNNSGCLKSADEQPVYGFWTHAYQISRYHIDADVTLSLARFNQFFDQFNLLSTETPIPYDVGTNDCQTVVHYLLRSITGQQYPSPHGQYTLGWGDGSLSPHEIYYLKMNENKMDNFKS